MAERLSMPIIQKHNFHTVAGFVLDRLGHLPRIGESFEEHGWQFEVIDMEGRRVDKILAKRIARAPRRAAL
jgi:putative hemolysin